MFDCEYLDGHLVVESTCVPSVPKLFPMCCKSLGTRLEHVPTNLQTAAWLSPNLLLFAALAAVAFLQPVPLLFVVCFAPPAEPSR